MREGFMEVVTLEPRLNWTQQRGHSRKRKEHRQGPRTLKRLDLFRDFKCFRVTKVHDTIG